MQPQRARDLPPDLGSLAPEGRVLAADRDSAQYAMSCQALAARLTEVHQAMAAEMHVIENSQAENGSMAVAGVLVPGTLLFMKDVPRAKAHYQDLDAERERLLRISQSRPCN
jgi:hypothetical protein